MILSRSVALSVSLTRKESPLQIWAGEFGTGPPYDFQWHINPGQNGAVQLRTTSHAPDESRPGMEQWRYRDMEVIPGDNHRVTMVTEGLHEDWFLIPAHR